MNTSDITISYHGAVITVKTADEAVQIAQRLTGVMPGGQTRPTNGSGQKHSSAPAMRPKRTPPRDALELAESFLTAVRDAPREGLDAKQAMAALHTTDTKGFGGRMGKVNAALRDLGYPQVGHVYSTEKGPRGKYRRPKRQLDAALASVQSALLG